MKKHLFILALLFVGVNITIPIYSTSDKLSIDISNFTPGIYFYSIEANEKIVASKKVIVK